MSGKTLVVLLGPTAAGKTALSIRLANTFQTEIISCDSRQFFREMSIGTAKPTPQELNQVPHHFINSLSVSEEYNAGVYEQEVLRLLSHLFTEKKMVFMAGGSGLYINAVCKGMDELPKADETIRASLNQILLTKGKEELQKTLKSLDPEHYAKVDIDNPHRMMRAIEVCMLSGRPYSSFHKGMKTKRDFSIIKIGLTMERAELYERINLRVDQMMEQGFLEEVKSLVKYRHLNALQTVGYKELFSYLDGDITLEIAVELIKQNTRRFAKRQLTWFRKDESIQWFHPSEEIKITEYIRQCSAL